MEAVKGKGFYLNAFQKEVSTSYCDLLREHNGDMESLKQTRLLNDFNETLFNKVKIKNKKKDVRNTPLLFEGATLLTT